MSRSISSADVADGYSCRRTSDGLDAVGGDGAEGDQGRRRIDHARLSRPGQPGARRQIGQTDIHSAFLGFLGFVLVRKFVSESYERDFGRFTPGAAVPLGHGVGSGARDHFP